MPSFNKVILAGNLTRDPELRHAANGTAICKIGLALNRSWTDEAGQKREEVTFVDVDFWGRTAETVAQYLSKGSPILVEGRLKLEKWTDKETKEQRQKIGITGESFTFIGGPSEKSQDKAAPGRKGGAK